MRCLLKNEENKTEKCFSGRKPHGSSLAPEFELHFHTSVQASLKRRAVTNA